MADVKTNYSEVTVEDVARYFVAGYDLKGEKLLQSDYFYDPHKGVFVFKLVTEAAEIPQEK